MANFRRRLVVGLGAALMSVSFPGSGPAQTMAMDGRELFLDVRKGNCAACHQLPGNPAGTGKSRMGPELTGIKGRYPDRAILRAAIWNLSDKVPNTIMPPYGKHRILTETEIDAVVRYLEMF